MGVANYFFLLLPHLPARRSVSVVIEVVLVLLLLLLLLLRGSVLAVVLQRSQKKELAKLYVNRFPPAFALTGTLM